MLWPIQQQILTIEELYLHRYSKGVAMHKRGLVIFVGVTGYDKTTSLVAVADRLNSYCREHSGAVEDHIGFFHRHKVGVDDESYEVALKNALWQALNVILIGGAGIRTPCSGRSIRRDRPPMSDHSACQQY